MRNCSIEELHRMFKTELDAGVLFEDVPPPLALKVWFLDSRQHQGLRPRPESKG